MAALPPAELSLNQTSAQKRQSVLQGISWLFEHVALAVGSVSQLPSTLPPVSTHRSRL